MSKINDWYKKLSHKLPKKAETSKYNSLAPTSNSENSKPCEDALSWALENSEIKSIKNIAITGPYGSGKSSVIKTFIRHYKENHRRSKYKFLNISLANFYDIEDEETSIKKEHGEKYDDSTKVQRLLELSILQQLFYSVKDTKIPNSRFKKIRAISQYKYIIHSLILVCYAFVLFFLINPEKLLNFFHIRKTIEFFNPFKNIVWIVLLIFVFFVSAFILYELIKGIKNIKINKFSYKAAELEIDKEISKSVLNNYVDEILYFFEVTKFNVVIIEDLDRFNQTEIFVKLRELNQLINASGSSVVFIYAIRDDMFKDKDRSKFFDFMIPILPVINYTNSNEILRKINSDNDYNLSNDFIEDISVFIDDMRLLYNVMNEFAILRQQLNPSLDQNQLLALIIYKNLYPSDFSLLGEHKGVLYELITKKTEYIKEQIANYDAEINDINKRIELVQKYQTTSVKELRMLYVLVAVHLLSQRDQFEYFAIGNNRVDILNMTEDVNFDALKTGKIQYYSGYYNNRRMDSVIDFHHIECIVDNNLSYNEREQLIFDKNGNNYLRDIELIKNKKSELRQMPLKKILSDYNVDLNCNNQNINMVFVRRLLENGYITEDYTYYISLFHEVSLTQTDYHFILNVKNAKQMEFDFPLCRTAEILKRLSLNDFGKDCVYNVYLLDEVLSTYQCKEKQDAFIKKITDESDKSMEFIDAYISRGKHVGILFKLMCKNWINIWGKVVNHNYTDNRKKKIFWLILKNASMDNTISIFNGHESVISNCSYFLKAGLDDIKTKNIITKLGIEFAALDSDSPKELLQFVYENNNYVPNKSMIKCMLKLHSKFDKEKFRTENFHQIKSSGCSQLIKYIEDNFIAYIQQTYLKISGNMNEPIADYMSLLNHSMPNEILEQVVLKINTTIDDVLNINNCDIVNILLKHNRIAPIWSNIIASYSTNNFVVTDELVHFLNDKNNISKLCEQSMPQFENDDTFCRDLINNKKLDIDSYKLIVKSMSLTFNITDSKWDYERVKILIDNQRIHHNNENYSELRNNYKKLHILLFKQRIDDFISFYKNNSIGVDGNDITKLLESDELSINQKTELLDVDDVDKIYEGHNVLDTISDLIIKHNDFKVRNTLIDAIILCKNISTEKRIMIFTSQYDKLSNDNVDRFLSSFGQPYNSICDKSIKAKLELIDLNKNLLDKLVSVGYISSYTHKNGYYMVNHKRDR